MKFRFLTSLLTPGGVLLLAAWALQNESVVREAAAPYVVYFCFGALAAAVLLSWYHDQSGLLCVASTAALTVVAFERWPHDPNGARSAVVILLPLNFILFASMRESGVTTLNGLLKVGVVAAQTAGVMWLAERGSGWSLPPLPWQVSFAIAAAALMTMVFLRRTKLEQGLLWALAAMFLGVNDISSVESHLVYAGTGGLVLVFAVLEHGYDIAYRDELTGLLGRRAFNSMSEQLGRTYAFAMCDVDHFKKFNDTYGHDVGDQVLKMVASRLSGVEGGGRVFRYGGEEFLVVFRGRSARDAQPFIEAVRKEIADVGFVLRGADRPVHKPWRSSEAAHRKQPPVTVTISVGLAEKSTRHSTPELVLDAADAALYAAKEAGRNCVRLDEGTPT